MKMSLTNPHWYEEDRDGVVHHCLAHTLLSLVVTPSSVVLYGGFDLGLGDLDTCQNLDECKKAVEAAMEAGV